MNTGGHITAGGECMREEENGHNRALTELRRRLAGGMTRARLNQTELAGLAGLGRTTVSEALSAKKPVPSAQTVEELARVLKLPVPELLELQRTATEAAGAVPAGGPGRPIGQWEPHDLEVHPASSGSAASGADTPAVRALPGYVRREHDRLLAEAVKDAAVGRSRIVFLVGSSSTGKTRACWEAVQPLADQGLRLWHPFDPTRARAALEDLHCVGPRTVVWLNEAQHYLGDRTAGEAVAAAVHHLLVSPERGPVLVLGTLWSDYARQFTVMPVGAEDPYSRVRELLAGRTVAVPDAFDSHALAAAEVLAEGGDRLLGDALTRARVDGRVTQDLASAPELLNRYQHASPAAKAVLEAAMDARHLGVSPHLPHGFLTDAAPDYLSQIEYDELTDDWAEAAFAELAKPVHGKQAPCAAPPPTATTPAQLRHRPRLCGSAIRRAAVPARRLPRTTRPRHPTSPLPTRLLLARRPHPPHRPRRPERAHQCSGSPTPPAMGSPSPPPRSRPRKRPCTAPPGGGSGEGWGPGGRRDAGPSCRRQRRHPRPAPLGRNARGCRGWGER